MFARIRDDVMEKYLENRDSENPDVMQAAILMDYLKGRIFPVVVFGKDEHQRMIVTLDVSEVFVFFSGYRIMDLTIEVELVELDRTCICSILLEP